MKLLLVLCLTPFLSAYAAPAGSQPPERLQQHSGTQFKGTIGTARFEMQLTRSGSTLSGSYFYDRSGSSNRLTLSGTIDDDGSFTMKEADAVGKQTGSFKGKWKEDPNDSGASLEGEWLKPGQMGEGLGFYAWEQMVYFTATRLTTAEIKESIKAKKAELSAEYPELSGGPKTAAFNQIVKARVTKSLDSFRKDMASLTAMDIKRMSGEVGNYIEISYNIEFADDDLISVSFGEDTFEGGAHPNHGTFTITYDLKLGRVMKLADLFKPGSRYLAEIADYVIPELRSRKDPESGENLGIAQDIFEDGAKPVEENYRNWNITRKGLLITFPPYQVAAYVYGPQEVMIPYGKLKDMTFRIGK